MILPIAGYYQETSIYKRWYSSDVTTSYTLRGMYCYSQKCIFAFNTGQNKLALHTWDFEEILSDGIKYSVAYLRIIDDATSATLNARDIFFNSPNGSDLYPFIYSIQVT